MAKNKRPKGLRYRIEKIVDRAWPPSIKRKKPKKKK
jgi:hypothetical protein